MRNPDITYHDLSKEEAQRLLQGMKAFYDKGLTRNLSYRKYQLRKLKSVIKKYEKDIEAALYKDLGKSSAESFMTEIGILYTSISWMLKNMDRHLQVKRAQPHLPTILSNGFIHKEPYGTVLIISAFNYPFQLLLEPLIGAIAAGNVAVVKPSEQAVYTEAVLVKIIKEAFPTGAVVVATGGKETVTSLTTAPFDYIFFTGSVPTGRIIMENAAKNLVPVTLELGGKSPALVMKRAEIKNAARKIVFGKFLNSGQTCIAPDYVLVHKDRAKELVLEMKKMLKKFYGEDPKASPDYGRIISKKSLKRLEDLLEKDREALIYGGKVDINAHYFGPTLLLKDDFSLATMEEEIFGPILPIILYEDLHKTLGEIEAFGKPLAFYVFTEDKALGDRVLQKVSFGGGCLNDVIFHIATPHLPFGGVGTSGMGNYHGAYSLRTFSHEKSILKSRAKFPMTLNEPPFSPLKEKLLRWVLR
ncbi:MAG TPA: aldehyde dehydrogenase [Clostridiaceae bacterium]|nr:aldehyde dehydrogenase [Clostridiaceae bacterium]